MQPCDSRATPVAAAVTRYQLIASIIIITIAVGITVLLVIAR